MKTVHDLTERLGELHLRTQETPLFNPVFQLSLDLSRELESGVLTLDKMAGLVAELECEGLKSRATRLHGLLAQPEGADLCGPADDFDTFRDRWEQPQLHAVFTAHPTFLLTPAQSAAVAQAASEVGAVDDTVCAVPGERAAITLEHEHKAAMAAMARAQDARDAIVADLLRQAQARWPDQWHSFKPLPFRFASWVGYDMDGRTDIGWHTSIAFRLEEKAERLARYTAALATIDPSHALLKTLRPAADFAARSAQDFSSDLSGGEAFAAAANRLTAGDPADLLSLAPLIKALESEAGGAASGPAGERAIALRTLAAAI